jgi:hypothetical protein
MQPQQLCGDGVQILSGVVDAFPEQTEASMSVDPPGSLRTYVVLELKEGRNGAMVCASEKEGQGAEEPGLLSVCMCVCVCIHPLLTTFENLN